MRSRSPKFQPGINGENVAAVAKTLDQLSYHGPVGLSWDDTDLEEALSVFEKSQGFFQVIGNVGGPINVTPTDDLEAVFDDATIKKAGKVSSALSLLLSLLIIFF